MSLIINCYEYVLIKVTSILYYYNTHKIVLDQRLPEYEAIADMKARAKTTKEPSRPVARPSRRKLVHTHKPSFYGSSPLVRKRSPNVCSLKCCEIAPKLYY